MFCNVNIFSSASPEKMRRYLFFSSLGGKRETEYFQLENCPSLFVIERARGILTFTTFFPRGVQRILNPSLSGQGFKVQHWPYLYNEQINSRFLMCSYLLCAMFANLMLREIVLNCENRFFPGGVCESASASRFFFVHQSCHIWTGARDLMRPAKVIREASHTKNDDFSLLIIN